MPFPNHLLTIDLGQLEFWKTEHSIPGSELSYLLAATQRVVHIMRGWIIQSSTGLSTLPPHERQGLMLSLCGHSLRDGKIQLALPGATQVPDDLVKYLGQVFSVYSAPDLSSQVKSLDLGLVSRLSSVHTEILDFLRLCDPLQAGCNGVMQVYLADSTQPFVFTPDALSRVKQLQGYKFLGQSMKVEVPADKVRFSNGRVDFKIRPGAIWNVRLPADVMAALRVQVHKTPRAKILMRGRPEMQFGKKSRQVTLFVLDSFDLLL